MKYAEYIERKHHGTPDFPIQHYLVNEAHSQYHMLAHWHREFEIIRVIEGSIAVHLNNVEYRLEKGDVVFAQGTCLHSATPTQCVYECIVFDPNMLIATPNNTSSEFISPIINSNADFKNLIEKKDSEIKGCVEKLSRALTLKEEYYELNVFSLLYFFFHLLLTHGYVLPKKKKSTDKKTLAIISLIDSIEKNFTDALTLDDLAAISGFNKKYLCRVFKEYTSKTPIEYINELRIEHAAFLIREKEKSVTDAAFESGFNELSYFCKIFKRYKGISPREYKKVTSVS